MMSLPSRVRLLNRTLLSPSAPLFRRAVVPAASPSSAPLSAAFSSSAPPPSRRNVVIVDGTRLPFAPASTTYSDLMAVDLMKLALDGLFIKTALPREAVDYVIAGNVIQEVRTSNIAREAAIGAGIGAHVGSHTVAMACISANQAICTAAEKIQSGRADVIIAGGCETFSDVPIRLTRPLRQKLIQMPKHQKKGPAGILKHLSGLKAKEIFGLETPAIANYTTGEVMGVSSDRLAARFGVSREDQDAFAIRSHDNAGAAHASGLDDGEMTPYRGSQYKGVSRQGPLWRSSQASSQRSSNCTGRTSRPIPRS